MVASLALVALAAVGPAPAMAAALQFATFSQTTGNPFQFTNNGGSSGSISGVAQVKFNFTALAGQNTADRDATVTFTGTAVTPAVSGAGLAVQPINGANTIKIIENSTGLNLLTVVYNGSISGFLGSSNASLSSDTATGNIIAYYSDYLTLFNGNPASFLVGLPTVTPPLSIGPGGFLNSFTSNALGSFSGTFNAVPAPTSMAMFGTGIVATLALAKRRKRLAELKSV